MSIRLRLSLLYTAILAVTLVIIGIILYTTQSQYTLNWLKQDLVISSETLSQSILQNYAPGPNPQPPDANGQAPGSTGGPGAALQPPPTLSLTNTEAFQKESQQEIVRVLDPSGTVIASPVGASEISLPLPADGLQALRDGKDWWSTQTVSGTRLLIYTHPVHFQGRVAAILQVARALTERDQSLQSLGRTLIIATLIAILAAFGMGWLLARETLRPIRRISQTAQAIGRERDFTRRVDYPGPPDEVGQLAQTFNTMLAQLEDGYHKVAHALEMQRSFVADVSHELRTPLTTLRGNLGLLGRRPNLLEEDQADILKDMTEESDRLIRLVNDLLVLARADAGRGLAKETLNICPVIEEACRQARQLAPEREISAQIPAVLNVTGDRDALKQVLLILLDNTLKHTQGNVSLCATTSGQQMQLCVQDEGPGIPSEQMAHVFDRFYRGEDRMGTPGLGLGLPIARALVEGQGGTITMDSEPGKGTTIQITLPCATASRIPPNVI